MKFQKLTEAKKQNKIKRNDAIIASTNNGRNSTESHSTELLNDQEIIGP